MNEFNIGDRIVTTVGRYGVIIDSLYSNLKECFLYTIQFDGEKKPFYRPIRGDDIQLAESRSYRWEVFQADNNVVTAVMYEVCGSMEKEIDRQHGHIMHSGEIGVAQAASYAMKKIYIGMNDGKYIGPEDN